MKAVLLALGLFALASFSTACATDVDDDGVEEEGETESAQKANYCKDFDAKGSGGCNRPVVKIDTSFKSIYDGDGKANAAVGKGLYGVSACTPKRCTIYAETGGGDLYTVDRATLLKNSAAKYAGSTAKSAIANRTMKTLPVGTAPTGGIAFATIAAVDIPEANAGGYAPADSSSDKVGSNESISARRSKKVLYGVETPQGKSGSLTGFVGQMVTRDGKPTTGVLVDVRDGNDWYTLVNGKAKATATTKWALLWTQTEDGYWAEQWVLASVTPKDAKKKAYTIVSWSK